MVVRASGDWDVRLELEWDVRVGLESGTSVVVWALCSTTLCTDTEREKESVCMRAREIERER